MTITDIFIIGGGINGVGIAADAANCGLSVMLCEQGDLAGATSSSSTKLIHGGLRYLEYYEFALVRKALKEREILLNKAPHITKPMSFVLPHAKHLRPAFLMRLGLFLYDHLAPRKKLPSSQKIKLADLPGDNPLKDDYKIGFQYSDGWVDDARLVVLNAIEAQNKGAQILVRTECKKVTAEKEGWKIELLDHRTQQTKIVYAKTIVNAAGPWVNIVLENVFQHKPDKAVQWVKGSHFIVPKLYEGKHAFILQNKDHRIVFVIPYQEHYSMIGTTDEPYHDAAHLDHIAISQKEIDYLCALVADYFKKPIDQKTIVWSYAGVRPLFGAPGQNPSTLTRDYALELHTTPHPLLNIYGGKITTYRILSEQAVEKLRPFLPHMTQASTAKNLLPGGETFDIQASYPWLPAETAARYARSYGSLSRVILEGCHALSDLGQHFGHGLYEKEVRYLVEKEWALTLEDILWRRSKLGLALSSAEQAALGAYLKSIA